MLSKEVIKKIRHIEITTKRLLSGSYVGDYSSAKKGTGFEFDQIRDYQMGDDVRFIDWKASARSNKLLVKQYIEERNRAVILVVDFSASIFYTSSQKLKFDVLSEIAAVLALVADYGKDLASLLLFTDKVEVFIPPARGRKHIHKIMEQLFSFKPKGKKTDINCALDRLAKLRRKDSIVFLLSDFVDSLSEKKLYVVSKMYDLVAIRCLDKNERRLPNVGFINIEDIESGEHVLLDTRGRGSKKINKFLFDRLHGQEYMFKRFGVDYVDVYPSESFISDIILFFRRRMMY
ncbi:DUF58 domain-containing protein [Candidatus Dependentiae bacterium]